MERIPFRHILMFILLIGMCNMYSQRMCMSIAVLCMANHTAGRIISENQVSSHHTESFNESFCVKNMKEQVLIDGPFIWDGATRGHILGAFFWGYLVGQIPSGFITRRFGSRRVIFVCLLVLASSTALLPVAAFQSIYLLYILRAVAGLASAAWFPGFYQLWSSWAPPNERGILVGVSYAGLHVGNAVTLPIAGALCQTSVGWSLVFYFYGACSLAYAFIWALLVYDSPNDHPKISDTERKLIISKCGDMDRKSNQKMKLPILSMVSSLPVWAFAVVIIGFDWNSYTLLTSIPSYMREVLYFDINENAGLSALPYTGVWFGQLWFGWLSDRLLSRNVFTLNVVRRLMTSVGMFGPGAVMIAISFFDCRYKYVVVALFTFGLMLNSSMFAGGLLNPIELSPRHSGIIFSAANTLSALTGVAAPVVVDVLTPQHSYWQWRNVFYVGAAVYFATGLFFICFSSSTIQPWAIVSEDRLDDAESYHGTQSGEVEPLNELSDPVVIKVVDAQRVST